MDKQEKIVCAAMLVKWKYKDLDFKNEEVICGVDHNLIRKSSHFMDRRYNYDREYFSFEKGFITSKNRFVDAKEAYKIAVEAKQIPSKIALIIDIDYRIIKAKNSKHYYSTATIKELEAEREIILNRLEELKLEDLY